MTPYKVDTSHGHIALSGPTLGEPRAFFTIPEARKAAEMLNAAWNDGWNAAFRERNTDG